MEMQHFRLVLDDFQSMCLQLIDFIGISFMLVSLTEDVKVDFSHLQWFSSIVKSVKRWRKNSMKSVNLIGICFRLSSWNLCRPSKRLLNDQRSFLALAALCAHEKFSKRYCSQFRDCLPFYFVQILFLQVANSSCLHFMALQKFW